MKDKDKTREHGLSELAGLRRRVTELEALEIEHKRTEQALLAAEEKFRVVFNESLDALMIIDCDSGHILRINPAAYRILGYEEKSLAGKHFATIFPPASDHSLKALRESLKVYGAVFTQDFLRADGSIWWMDLTATLIPWNKDKAILATLRDITERVQAEEEKEHLQAQLRQSHKMEAIGTLAGGIAHDFNNILGIIVGNTELAMDDVPETNPARDNLNEVHKACLRAKDLVRHILSFARRTEQARIPVRISSLFKESLKLLRSSIPTTISMDQNISCESDTVLADPTQIDQVVINLCTNAAHAMAEEGGILEVSLQNVELGMGDTGLQKDEGPFGVRHGQSQIGSSSLAPGNYVRLTVRDTGPGIEPQFIDRIFDPYFTTKEADEGTGMGLSVVHGIVKSHGGAITVDSEPGKGATFQVFLPTIQTEVTEAPENSEALPRGSEKILFVDDEAALAEVGKEMLERLGYEVVTTTSGVGALDIFRAQPEGFDLVITDMTMPKMKGDNLAEALTKIHAGIPIMVCGGQSEQISKERAKSVGIRAFVMKPVLKQEIAETVRKVLDES
jgi:PAS domain S-box-containing protein